MRLAALVGVVALLAVAAVAHAAGGGADVTIPARLYAPGELDLLAGETVTWRNTDSKSHTVTSDSDLFDSGFLAPGSSFSETFRTTGVFTYHCAIHRSMRGVVRVFALIFNGPPRALPPAWAVKLRGVSPEPGSTVVLERVGPSGRIGVAQTTADVDGSFTFTLRPVEPAAYRARSGEARSPVLRIAVTPNVAAAVVGRRLIVSTKPNRTGSVVALQLYDRERFDWLTVAKERLDGASHATFRLPKGLLRLRAVVRGRDGWADGVSRTFVLRRTR